MQRIIKEELVNMVCEETGCPKTVVKKIIDSTLRSITSALSQGKEVRVSGFGTFKVKQCAARTGRSLITNEPIAIPARKVPSFKPGKQLKDVTSNNLIAERR